MAKKVISMDLEKYVSEMRRRGLAKDKKNDIAVLCPLCYKDHQSKGDNGYRKLKLWIESGLSYGQCWRCGTVFISDDQSLNTSVKRLESPIDMSNWKLCPLGSEGYWTLDRFESFDVEDEEGIDYLAHRIYLYRKMYKMLGIRFKDHNPVTPFYYKGQLIYYQMRIIDKDSKIKYYSPSIDHKPPYILEHGDNTKFIICEGTFDAIACRILYPDRTPFAVLGSDITPYQIAMLRSYCPEDILIYMDKSEISYRIKDSISKYINYAEISIVPSTGQDPEEALKESLLNKSYEEY